MKTIVRLLAIGLLILLLLVGGLVTYIDRIAQAAVERGASTALGVTTTLGGVHIGFVSGKFSIENLAVANPPGFAKPQFLNLGRAELHLPLRALLDDPIIVPSIELRDIELTLERSGKRTNYGAILDNLDRLGSAEEPAPDAEPPSEGEEPARRFVIRELRVTDAPAQAGLAAGGTRLAGVTVELPDIVLHDIGAGEAAGIPLEQVVALLTQKLLEAVAKNGSGLPGALTRELNAQLGKLGLDAGALPSSAAKAGKQIEQKLQGGIQKELQKALGKDTKTLPGLPDLNQMFGGQSDEK